MDTPIRTHRNALSRAIVYDYADVGFAVRALYLLDEADGRAPRHVIFNGINQVKKARMTKRMVELGLIAEEKNAIALTPLGQMVADGVADAVQNAVRAFEMSEPTDDTAEVSE